MTDPIVRRLPPLPVYGSPPLDDALPFVMHDEGPICTDKIPPHREDLPATRAQAAEITRLLTDIRDQLARAFGPGR